MENLELALSLPVLLWSLLAVAVGLFAGFLLGRTFTLLHEPARLKKDRQTTLRALTKMLESSEQMTSDMDTHNDELASVQKSVSELETDESIEQMQQALMTQIVSVVNSNRRLEGDLVITRYQLEQHAQELDRSRHEARTDELSGVANRKSFDETLHYLISKFHAKKKPFGLVILDVDHFKRINDSFGHLVGDQVVTRLGALLKDCVRPQDHVARLGGDEFAILLEGLKLDDASRVTSRIQQTIEQVSIDVGDGTSRVALTLSIGVAVARDGDTGETIYERADKALYRSKERGRNVGHVCDNDNNIIRLAS